jgi:hypothetical protein
VAHAVAKNRSVAEVAAEPGLGWTTVQACVDEHTDKVLIEPAPTPVLGTTRPAEASPAGCATRSPNGWVRVDRWDTGFVDLHGEQRLLGQTEGRTSATVVGWLGLRSQAFRDAIRYVVIDPAAAYRAAITADLLPNAQLVVDHFHPVKLANDAVTAVRRRVTWQLRNRRGPPNRRRCTRSSPGARDCHWRW